MRWAASTSTSLVPLSSPTSANFKNLIFPPRFPLLNYINYLP